MIFLFLFLSFFFNIHFSCTAMQEHQAKESVATSHSSPIPPVVDSSSEGQRYWQRQRKASNGNS